MTTSKNPSLNRIVEGLGFEDFRFRVSGFEFRVSGLRC